MKFNKSFLSELIKLALPDVFSKFALITREDQKNGLFDNIIALKDPEENDQVCKLIGFLLGVSGFPFLRVSITKKREPISKFILIHFNPSFNARNIHIPFCCLFTESAGWVPITQKQKPTAGFGFPETRSLMRVPRSREPETHPPLSVKRQ